MNPNLSTKSCFLPLAFAASLLLGPVTNAAVTVLGVQYQQDNPYTNFQCIWHDRYYPTNCGSVITGANVHVYIKNNGGSSVTISDATLTGYSLATVIKTSSYGNGSDYLSSIYYYWDVPPQDIMDAGEPVWYKADPSTVPAGGVAQVVVRLRHVPTNWVALGVVTSGGTVTTNLTVDGTAPQLASIGYSADRMNVYLHWRRDGGTVPTSVYMDGTNVTPLTTTVGDPGFNFGASVISLSNALPEMSYHVYQGVYADGKTATASQRVWTNKFIYATYNTFTTGGSLSESDWVAEASDHGFNNVQMNMGNLNGYLGTSGGAADGMAHNYGYTILGPTKLSPYLDPDMWFLNDEPDAEEGNQAENNCGTGLKTPCGSGHDTGVLAKTLIAYGETLRAKASLTPTVVNIDGNLKPDNLHAWGQTVDVLQTDPYYQPDIADAYWNNPQRIPLYQKATFVYAVSRAAGSAAEPNPHNVLLYCNRLPDGSGGYWPFPTPACKRIEAYYALAGGAKGMGYWWFNKPDGLDAQTSDALTLWKEMGLIGNEIKTAQPLLVRSTPVDMTITPNSANSIWARSLAAGPDTIILILVNDNYYNDITGCHYTSVPNANVTVALPAWMQSPMAFEVSAGGLKAVSTQPSGNQLQVNLGTFTVTRMIVLTKNAQIPLLIQQRYDQQVRVGICNMATEYCTNSAPTIVVPPQSQTVVLGKDATFVVTASAVPAPTYNWRFYGTNLAGATSASYTRSNARSAHAGDYTVVVSNSLGAVTSVVATLNVSTNGVAPGIITPPQSQNVAPGANVNFTVTANGTAPLSYQWRLNSTNIASATDSSYTRPNVQSGDAGNYAVVVTNSAGAITSAPAVLTVSVPIICTPVSLVNGGFEITNTTGVATGWTGYQRAPNPTTVWTIQTAGPPGTGSTNYQQIANTSSTGGGGVRQNVTGCVVGATYVLSGWMRGNSGLSSTCTVKVSPTASTNWATAMDLNPPQTLTGNTWTNFSGTVVATGTNMTIWLDGQTGGTGLNKAECFDSVTLSCLGGAPAPPHFDLVTWLPQNQPRLVLSGTAGGSITIQRSSNLVNWVALTNLVNTNGTLEFIDTSAGVSPEQFYRATSP